MRKLNGDDVLSCVNALTKMGVDDTIKNFMVNKAKGASAEKYGVDLIFNLLSQVTDPKSRRVFWDWLASPMEVSADELAQMDVIDLMDQLIAFGEANDLVGFFERVQRFVKVLMLHN